MASIVPFVGSDESDKEGDSPVELDSDEEMPPAPKRPKSPQFSSEEEEEPVEDEPNEPNEQDPEDEADLSGIQAIREGASSSPNLDSPDQYGNDLNLDSIPTLAVFGNAHDLEHFQPIKVEYAPKHYCVVAPVSVNSPGKRPYKYLALQQIKDYGSGNYNYKQNINVLDGLISTLTMIRDILKNPKSYQRQINALNGSGKGPAKKVAGKAIKAGKVIKAGRG